MGNQIDSFAQRNKYLENVNMYQTKTYGNSAKGIYFNACYQRFFLKKIMALYNEPHDQESWHLAHLTLTLTSINKSEQDKIIQLGARANPKMCPAGQINIDFNQNNIKSIKIGFDDGGLAFLQILDNEGIQKIIGYSQGQDKQNVYEQQINGFVYGLSGTASETGIQSLMIKYKPLPFLKSQIQNRKRQAQSLIIQ